MLGRIWKMPSESASPQLRLFSHDSTQPASNIASITLDETLRFWPISYILRVTLMSRPDGYRAQAALDTPATRTPFGA